MKTGSTRKKGVLLLITGSAIIFIASALNSLHGMAFDGSTSLSRGIYLFDVLSTFGVVIIPWGLTLVLRKEGVPPHFRPECLPHRSDHEVRGAPAARPSIVRRFLT
ncbi:MAG: hypothetical protein RDV48_18050 [Candidatus Eremiobacteraeota bacterium]|nr:hypothetical protein [Candidatus Eremiobacteraeota bacterium]